MDFSIVASSVDLLRNQKKYRLKVINNVANAREIIQQRQRILVIEVSIKDASLDCLHIASNVSQMMIKHMVNRTVRSVKSIMKTIVKSARFTGINGDRNILSMKRIIR
jgi:hypothetical protein